MTEILLDALVDTVKMIPLLLIIYFGIELVEFKFGNSIRQKVQKAGSAGPLLGALAGLFPQCGFSVVTAALYTQRLVTVGTFLAVLISTSDEAIPIILSQPDKAYLIWPLILTKLILALFAGYAVDLIFRRKNKKTLDHIKLYAEGGDDAGHHHESVIDEPACCGHSTSAVAKKFNSKELIWHPIKHTLKITFFIFIVTLALNLLIFYIGEANFTNLFAGHIFWQPFVAALVGLIPNCAASVMITQLYLNGAISYGAVIAGLSASGGLGILVLFKEDKDKNDIFKVIGLLFAISVISGLAIQYIF